MNIIKTNRRALQSGTTLIELSVVIAVILLLATVLFMGVTAWKNGANRAASVVAISSIQKAVRGAQNMLQYPDAKPYTIGVKGDLAGASLVGDGFFTNAVNDPITGKAFADVGAIPAVGALFAVPDGSLSGGVGKPLGPQIDISNW
jgi:prepilin-type N-terminal cleavage/methylation domain-containing protein